MGIQETRNCKGVGDATYVIDPTKTERAAPILFALRSDRTLQFCVEFNKVNAVFIRDSYPYRASLNASTPMVKPRVYRQWTLIAALAKCKSPMKITTKSPLLLTMDYSDLFECNSA